MKTLFGKPVHIFTMYLQTLDSLKVSRAQPDLSVRAVFRLMICFKSESLIKNELRRAQSWPRLHNGKEPVVKY